MNDETEPILGGIVVSRPTPIQLGDRSSVKFQLQSDLHYGAAHVDYGLIKREWDWALENDARILINGDIFDAIFPTDKKRSTPDVLHPRLQGTRTPLTQAVRWAADDMAPYAHLIDVIGVGNHDTACEKHHNIDPVALLIEYLHAGLPRKHKDHIIHHGGYGGFVDYRFRTNGRMSEGHGGQRWVIYYHHGSGAAAPVTKGMIDFNRKDTFIDADFLWMGHKHNRWSGEVQKLSCPLIGEDVKIRDVKHCMTGGYFNTYVGQSQASIKKHGRRTNYAADAGMAPQGMGGARVEVVILNNNKAMDVLVTQ